MPCFYECFMYARGEAQLRREDECYYTQITRNEVSTFPNLGEKLLFRWAICSNSVLAIMFMKELCKILADKNYIVKLRYSLFVLIK